MFARWRLFFFVFIATVAVLPLTSYAVVYSPGATLDPACVPGPLCTVDLLSIYDETGALATTTTVSALEFTGAGVTVTASTTLLGGLTITIPGGGGLCTGLDDFACDGGNALGATFALGTTDAQDFNILSGGATLATFNDTGQVQIFGDSSASVGTPGIVLYNNSAVGTDPLITYVNSAGLMSQYVNTGSPEGVITADSGSIYHDSASGFGALYVKTTDGVNTGWIKLSDGADMWSMLGNANATSGSYLGPQGAVALKFFTNGAERMSIGSTTGYVGIGTSSPNSTLHIATNLVATTSILTLENNDGDFQMFFASTSPEGSITGTRGDLALVDDTAAGLFYIKRTGAGTNTGWVEILTASSSAICSWTGSGANNECLGSNVLLLLTTGSGNTSLGDNAHQSMTTGSNNIAVGYRAGQSMTTASGTIAIGTNAARSTTASSNTLAIGYNALGANTTGTVNLALGYNALATNVTGTFNVAIGDGALDQSAGTALSYNLAIGFNALGGSGLTTGDNLAIGNIALQANTSGTPNLAIGKSALSGNTTGSNNLAIGAGALQTNTTSSNNLAIGSNALLASTAGDNLAIGRNALTANSIGTNNLAIGYGALDTTTSAVNNLAIGANAMGAILVGNGADNNLAIGSGALGGALTAAADLNVAIGLNTLFGNTSGGSNIAIGYSTLQANTTGSNNLAIGVQALDSATVALNNLAIGNSALGGIPAGINADANVAIGRLSQSAILTGTADNNISIGYNTLIVNTSGAANIAIGTNALSVNTVDNNVAIGYGSLDANTTGTPNLAIGRDALGANTTGSANLAIGRTALQTITTGTNNLAIGDAALDGAGVATAGNLAIGANALGAVVTTGDNLAIGFSALAVNTSGTNFAIGGIALDANTTGTNNLALGYDALGTNITGNANTAIGRTTLRLNTASNSIGIGDGVLALATSGGTNIAIGRSAGDAITTGSGNLIIGDNLDVTSATAVNEMNIGGFLFGTGINALTGFLGIGTTSPVTTLSANGKMYIGSTTATTTATSTIAHSLNVQGALQIGTSSIYLQSYGTSTFNSGVNFATVNGCVAHNGTCILGAATSTMPWVVTGNFGLNSNTNFLGTTDAVDLVFRTNNISRATTTTTGGWNFAGETGGGGVYTMNVGASVGSHALRVTGIADTIYAQQGGGADVFFIRTSGGTPYINAATGGSLHLGVGGTTDSSLSINSSGDTTIEHRLVVSDGFTGSGSSRVGVTIASASDSGNQTSNTTQLLILPDDGGVDSTATNIGLNVNMGSLSGGTNVAALFQNGNVGIGNTAPATLLHVGSAAVADASTLIRTEDANSTCNFTADAGGPACGSDATLKKNIITLGDNLEKINALRVVSYNWKTDADEALVQDGFIAQEVQEVLPKIVSNQEWIDGSDRLFLSMGSMMPYVVGAVQELSGKIDTVEATTTALMQYAFLQQASTTTSSLSNTELMALSERLNATDVTVASLSDGMQLLSERTVQLESQVATTATSLLALIDESRITKADLEALIEIGGATTSLATLDDGTIDEQDTFLGKFYKALGAWMGEAGNGIRDLFADRIFTKEICLTRDDGTYLCVTANDLEEHTGFDETVGEEYEQSAETPLPPVESTDEENGGEVAEGEESVTEENGSEGTPDALEGTVEEVSADSTSPSGGGEGETQSSPESTGETPPI